jgi:hypothetical protein
MDKPQFLAGYSTDIAEQCERLLGSVLRGMGPWEHSVYLIGGLVPRYLVKQRPPQVPQHAGTGDVDIVVDLQILAEVDAYRTLEENLKKLDFERGENRAGARVNYRWRRKVGDAMLELEFLGDDPAQGERLLELPSKGGNITALNIPHSSIVFDFHEQVRVSVDLLDNKGVCDVTIRHADIVCHTALKALAFRGRAEPKDAHDLVYCLEHGDGGTDAAARKFSAGLASKHGEVLADALNAMTNHFMTNGNSQGYVRDGSVAVANFEVGMAVADRERRILRQREASDVVSRFVDQVHRTRVGDLAHVKQA